MTESENKFEQIPLSEKYRARVDDEGFISITDFATTELRRQAKSVAGLLDGDEGQAPEYNLGEGLRFKGSSGNYSDMKLHVDDLDTFIQRVNEYFG